MLNLTAVIIGNEVMKFKNFDNFADIKYGVSEKSDGAMELAAGGLTSIHKRSAYFKGQGIDVQKTVSPKQLHSAKVVKVSDKDRNKIIPGVDGLATSRKNLFLTITVADCFPIYFFDAASNTVGLSHSGWRGTVKNIAAKTVKVMSENPANIIVGIGPGIQACHFEIKEDILENFLKYPEAIINRDGKIFIDLPKIIRQELIEAGLKNQNIESSGECTFCEKEKYFSFRRDKPKNVEAMAAYVGLLF